jgi:hypothetical protein
MLIFAALAYLVPLALVLVAWRHRQTAGDVPAWRRDAALVAFGIVFAYFEMA